MGAGMVGIAKFYGATPQEGGAGATIIELKVD